MDLIFSLFGRRIARKLAEDHYRPRNFTDLSFAFTDKEGRKYYAYRNLSELPTSRFTNLQSVLRMADAGMDRKEAKWLGDQILKSNDKLRTAKSAEQRRNAHAELDVLAKQVLIERAEVIPEDVYYDMAATCCVREDEDPGVIDMTIHLQKFAFLRDAGHHGASFFLHMPLFDQLLQRSLTSEAALIELLPIWNREKRKIQTIREVFAQRSQEQRQTSNSSSAA